MSEVTGDKVQASGPRVGILVHALPRGGAERQMVLLAGALAARGVEVDLLLFYREGSLLSEVSPLVRVIELGLAGRRKSRRTILPLIWQSGRSGLGVLRLRELDQLRVIPRLRNYIEEHRPDALLATLVPANVVAILATRQPEYRTRVIIREANTFSVQAADNPSVNDLELLKLAHRWYKEADRVVAVSAGVGADLAKTLKVPEERLAMIPNGLDLEVLTRRMDAPLEHAWFDDPNIPVILGVGRLAVQKAFDVLIEAFARVRQQRRARLLILGEGSLRLELKALIDKHGLEDDAIIPGETSNVYRYMARADLFVLSSYWEGFPNVLIEAMACGCPVVATDCPSGPSEILEQGRFGPLVPMGDPVALADAMLATLDAPLPRQELQARGRYFGVDRMADSYLSVLLPSHGHKVTGDPTRTDSVEHVPAE